MQRENSWKVSDTEAADYGQTPMYQVKAKIKAQAEEQRRSLEDAYDEKVMLKRQEALAYQTPAYKFNEGQLLNDLRRYVDKTYGQHYAQNRFQATEFIIDSGHGAGFCLGNVMKYAQRYGKKAGKNRADLLKVLHYALIMLYVHDLEQPRVEGE